MPRDHLSGKLAVILHADVEGSTALVRQNEQLAHERIRNTFHRFSKIISQYKGCANALRRIGRPLQIGAGSIVILMGIAMVTGYLLTFSYWLLKIFPVHRYDRVKNRDFMATHPH